MKKSPINNAIRVIMPYQWNGLWVFDDEATGLDKEAFVAGADTMIDRLTVDIPDARNGFVCMFSDKPFPTATAELTWVRGEEGGGDWYRCGQLEIEGWFCPALLLYFKTPPKKMYAAFLPRDCKNKK